MESTVRATCPKCQSILRIPAQWVGRAMKCKKCGALVRSKAKEGPPPDDTAPNVPLPQAVPAPAQPNAFDFDQPSADGNGPFGFPPQPVAVPVPNPYPAPAFDANGYPLPTG